MSLLEEPQQEQEKIIYMDHTWKEDDDKEENIFMDNSNNKVRLNKKNGNMRVFELVDEPGKGYVTTLEENEIWPGGINSWFGPSERYATAEDAIREIKASEEKAEK